MCVRICWKIESICAIAKMNVQTSWRCRKIYSSNTHTRTHGKRVDVCTKLFGEKHKWMVFTFYWFQFRMMMWNFANVLKEFDAACNCEWVSIYRQLSAIHRNMFSFTHKIRLWSAFCENIVSCVYTTVSFSTRFSMRFPFHLKSTRQYSVFWTKENG